KFKKLVEEKNVACYIVNTGDFMDKKVQKEDTLGILEAVVENKASFKQWGPFEDIEIMEWEGFVPDLSDKSYRDALENAMKSRLSAVEGFRDDNEGYDALPDEALEALKKIVEEVESL
ncbi:MAG: phosphoenolpyruvate carboxykinase, partial [Lachnospiraceae bacterium]|nr:phosphoenolpyruvate carboxykinase [Lachnospiraceae bacterium]